MIFMMMGPRQMAGASRSTRKPRDMSFTPCPSSGWILPPSIAGFCDTPHHARDVGTVDVGVHEPDAKSGLRERGGQVGRHSRLPHAPLPRRHGEHTAEVGLLDRRGWWWDAVCDSGGRPAARRPRHIHGHSTDAGHCLHRFPSVPDQCGRVLAREEQREGHATPLDDCEVAHHARGEKILGKAGVLDTGQSALNKRAEGLR